MEMNQKWAVDILPPTRVENVGMEHATKDNKQDKKKKKKWKWAPDIGMKKADTTTPTTTTTTAAISVVKLLNIMQLVYLPMSNDKA